MADIRAWSISTLRYTLTKNDTDYCDELLNPFVRHYYLELYTMMSCYIMN